MTEQPAATVDRKQEQVLRHQQVADSLKNGSSIRAAMLDAGYSEGKAGMGIAGLPVGVINQLASDGERYIKLGKQFRPEDRAQMVRGKLVENVLLGKDSATKSLELLGKDVAVGIFKSDSSSVNVQINLPGGLEAMFGELKSEDRSSHGDIPRLAETAD